MGRNGFLPRRKPFFWDEMEEIGKTKLRKCHFQLLKTIDLNQPTLQSLFNILIYDIWYGSMALAMGRSWSVRYLTLRRYYNLVSFEWLTCQILPHDPGRSVHRSCGSWWLYLSTIAVTSLVCHWIVVACNYPCEQIEEHRLCDDYGSIYSLPWRVL